MRLGDRLGGHMVQGHVDGVAVVTHRRSDGEWEVIGFGPSGAIAQVRRRARIDLPRRCLADRFGEDRLGRRSEPDPETLAATTLGAVAAADRLNVEVDVIGKYVESPARRLSMRFDPIPQAIEAIREGKAVVVVDDEDRENEGDLVFAASKATPANVGFMIRHTSGVICVSMQGEDLDRLHLPR